MIVPFHELVIGAVFCISSDLKYVKVSETIYFIRYSGNYSTTKLNGTVRPTGETDFSAVVRYHASKHRDEI
jgi:hypothetical protein